jgi:hypothetical protein
MKLQCRQCGALIAVTSPDAYTKCRYCGAIAAVSGFSGTSFLHRVLYEEKDILRLFGAGEISSVSLYWFPYDPDTMKKVFTQPFSEMDDYSPPSADRRVWDEPSVEGTIVSVDPELVGEGGVIYHPFWVVINSLTAQGTIIDGVSGIRLGETQGSSEPPGFSPAREAASAFLTGIVPALLLFFFIRGISVFWASVFGMAAALFAPEIRDRIKKGRSS